MHPPQTLPDKTHCSMFTRRALFTLFRMPSQQKSDGDHLMLWRHNLGGQTHFNVKDENDNKINNKINNNNKDINNEE